MMPEYFIRENALAGATVTPVAEELNYPASDVLHPYHYRRWRVSGSTAEVDFDLVSSSNLDAFLTRFVTNRDPTPTPHRYGSNDAIQLWFWDTSPSGTLLFNASRALSVNKLGYSYWKFDSRVSGVGYVRVRITAPDLIAAGGLLEIENMWTGWIDGPRFNFSSGASDETNDNTEIDIGVFSGVGIGEPKARYARKTRQWQVWSDTEAAWWEEFERSHGTLRPFVYVARPTRSLERAFLCRFDKDGAPRLGEGEAGTFTVRAEIIESR